MVWSSTTDKDFGVVFLELGLGLSDGPDDSLERIGDVGKVGNAAANDEDLAIRMGMFAHEINNSFVFLFDFKVCMPIQYKMYKNIWFY